MATVCTVSGTLVDLSGTAIANAVISVSSQSTQEDGSTDLVVPALVSTTSDTNGDWTIDLIETTTNSKTVTFKFTIPDGAGGSFIQEYNVIIPNAASAAFNSLIS